jgi:hypothetical protein
VSPALEAITSAVLGLLCFLAALAIDAPWCWSLLAIGAASLGWSMHAVITASDRRSRGG